MLSQEELWETTMYATTTDTHPKKIDHLVDAILNDDRDALKKPSHKPVVISSPSKQFDQIDI